MSDGDVSYKAPHYDLTHVQELIRTGKVAYNVTKDARALGIAKQGMKECLCALEAEHFHKTSRDWHVPEEWQDVYRCRFCDIALYIKFTMRTLEGRIVMVTSFKRDEKGAGDV